MRYKAYYSKLEPTDIKSARPSMEDYDLLDEDDDQHKLQLRIREKGIEYVKRVRIIDTLYEERFNKKLQEVQNGVEQIIRVPLQQKLDRLRGTVITEDTIQEIKKMTADTITESGLISSKISPNSVFVKTSDGTTYEIGLPTYNINFMTFKL